MASLIHSHQMLVSKIKYLSMSICESDIKKEKKSIEQGKWEGAGEAGLRTHCAIPDFNMWYSNELSHALHREMKQKYSATLYKIFLHKTS